MNKIMSWTIGSFFRTLGRIFAYLIIGLIIGFIISKAKVPKISNILNDTLFMRVNASETMSFVWTDDYYKSDGSKPNTGFFGRKFTHTMEDSPHNGGSFNIYFNQNGNFDSGMSVPSGSKYAYFKYFLYSDNSLSYSNFAFNVFVYTSAGGTLCETVSDNHTDFPRTFEGTTVDYFISRDIVAKCPIYENATYLSAIKFDYLLSGYNNDMTINLETYGDWVFVKEVDSTFNDSSVISAINRNASVVAETIDDADIRRHVDDTLNTQQIINNQNSNSNSVINNQNINTNKTIETITDDTAPNTTTLDNSSMAGLLPAGPLDSALNLPLNIMNSLVNKLSGTCQPISIPLPFINRNLTIPCIDTLFSSITGLNLALNGIFSIIAGIILYNYILYLYSWVDNITSLRHGRPRFFGAKSDIENWGSD